MKPYVRGFSNTKIHFQNPLPQEILLVDMFYQLARLPRFNASTSRIYTVGEHSLAVAAQMPGKAALIGLLHDGAEYVFNDVASPIVRVCSDYQNMRDAFQEIIYKKFLPTNLYFNLGLWEETLHEIDKDYCLTEMYHLKGRDLEPTQHLIPAPLSNMTPEQTELELHRAYHNYLELARNG